MTKIEALLGRDRLWQFEMIANHTANLRLMAELGPVIKLMDTLLGQIPPAQLGLAAREVALGKLRSKDGTWLDEPMAKEELARRNKLLAELRTAAKQAADKSGALSKMTKKASAPLYEQITHIDNSLHHIEELMEALEKNENECASAAVASLLAPLAALSDLAAELRQQARTEAGLKFDWSDLKSMAIIFMIGLPIFSIVWWIVMPAIAAHYHLTVGVAFSGPIGVIPQWLRAATVMLGLIIPGAFMAIPIAITPMLIKEQIKTTKKAAAIIASGVLPPKEEEDARVANENLQLVSRLTDCLGDGNHSDALMSRAV